MKFPFCYLLLLILAVGQLGQAQDAASRADSPEEVGLPGLPDSRVIDYGGIFSRDDGGFSELERRLDELYRRFGYSVYFVAYSGIIGSDVQTRCDEFRDQWLRDGVEGLVFVCDTDLERAAFSLTKVDFASGEEKVWLLPDHLVLEAMRQVYQNAGDVDHESESEFLRFMGKNLASRLEELLEGQARPQKGVSPLYLVAFAGAGLLILALAAWARRCGRQEILQQTSLVFPEIEIPSRLGAQYGGGLVCEMSYRPSSSGGV